MDRTLHRDDLHAVFVYGTLMSGHMYHELLRGYRGEPASAEGFELYRGPGYPFAVPGEGSIHGELYAIDTATLMQLDALEGYPELFTRTLHEVQTDSDSMVEAWIYSRNQPGNADIIPSGIWTTEFEYEEETA